MDEKEKSELALEVMSKMPSERTLFLSAELFKVLGDSCRAKIIATLYVSPLCVGDIAAAVDLSQPAVSYHLRILRQANIVRYARKNHMVIYTLADEHIYTIYKMAMTHIEEC